MATTMTPRLPLLVARLGRQAEPYTCPKCSTVTWSRNMFVVRCRYCNHVHRIER